ncbi:ABC transporter substrate-binding protein [Flavobacterium sp. JP2137]|uniref:ABC transporter substrate-binding protein n=1 Tax=Flavobacterium sp. JP2137 TaxID=3414510 RepID=UPI003D2FEFF8
MKSLTLYISIICILLALQSCRKNANSNSDHLVFRYNESANIQTLDPAFSRNQAILWPCNQLFNGLVQLDDSLAIQPDIAKSWSLDSTGKTYRFILRNDVYFHAHINFGKDSTRAVVASDFTYSFDRLLAAKTASPGAWILQKVARYTAVNDSVFQVELKEPFPAFLGLLSMKYASVVPREILEDNQHDFRSHPIGTGPFYFKFWEENIKLVLRKNKRYFERDQQGNALPYLESVAITFLPDKQSAFLQFIQGKLDFISGLDPSYTDEILTDEGQLQEKYQDRIQLVTGPYLNTEYLGFNLETPDAAIGDKRIRMALNLGFDRHKMLLYLRNGMGSARVKGIIPEGLAGYKADNGVVYNPIEAKALVRDFVRETGVKPVLTLSTNASYIDIAEYLQREWQKIGVEVRVDVSPPATLRQGIATGKVAFFRGSWIADYPDAENYLSLFYSHNKAPNGPNYTRYDNPDFDRAYRASFSETKPEKRALLYGQMDEFLYRDVPVIVLFYDRVARFSQKNVSGLGINPMNALQLKRVKKD